MIDALIAYKKKYAQIISRENNKFHIKIENKITKKVREKDFRYLYPKFSPPLSLRQLQPKIEHIDNFAGELITIADLAELLFDEYSASSAWQAYVLVEDGLYCFWQQDKIFIRPQIQVNKIKSDREQKQQQQVAIDRFLSNMANDTFVESDVEILTILKKIALNQLKDNKLCKSLGILNTKEHVHKLLVKIGYLDISYNPYPVRSSILLDQEQKVILNTAKNKRTDLTHLKSYAIDNHHNNDADDAISIDGDRIFIHTADISNINYNDIASYIDSRVSNLYLADKVFHMLPIGMSGLYALNSGISAAISISFKLNDDGIISDIHICRSTIKVVKISYNEANNLLNSTLLSFNNIANNHRKFRQKNGAISVNLPQVDIKLKNKVVVISSQFLSDSRIMISEFMILAGRVIAMFATKYNIIMPFVLQNKADIDLADNKNLTISQSFALLPLFKRSKISVSSDKHHGLGVDKYVRWTSPLRRYLDFIAQVQLINFLDNRQMFDVEQMQKFITINNTKLGLINKVVKQSNMHYKLLYLLQHVTWQGKAIVLAKKRDKIVINILSLALTSLVKYTANIDDEIIVAVKDIDIYLQDVSFKVIC